MKRKPGEKRMRISELEDAFRADPGRDEVVVALVGALGMAGEVERALDVALSADRAAGGRSVVRAVALGSAYELLGRHGEAEEAFLRALRLDRNETEAALGLARARMGLGDQAGAVASARLAANLDGRSEVSRLLLVEALLLAGDAAEARAAAGDIPLARWSPWARARLSDLDCVAGIRCDDEPDRLLLAAAAAARLCRPTGVRTFAHAAADAAPRDVEVLAGAGRVCLVAELLDDAVDLLGKALTVCPGHAAASDCLGTAYLRKGMYMQAVKFGSQATGSAPGEAVYHYNLGNAWAAWSRHGEAARCYERALELDPELSEAAHNLRVVRGLGSNGDGPPGGPAVGGEGAA